MTRRPDHDPDNGADASIRFFEPDAPTAITTTSTARLGSSLRRRVGAGLGVLVVVGLLGATIAAGPDTTDDVAGTPTTSTADDPDPAIDDLVESAGPSSAIVSFERDGTPILFGPADRNTFFTQPYAIVRVDGDDRLHRVTLGLNGIDTVTLPSLERRGLDAEGRMVALISTQGALLAGPVDGDLSILATGVVSFAWHDQEPARLAFVTRSNPDAIPDRHEFVVGQAPAAVLPGRPAPAADLIAFGAWGDAYRTDGTGLMLASPSGDTTVETAGRVLGGLGDEVAVARPRAGGTTRIADDAVQRITFTPEGAEIVDVPSAALTLLHLDLGDRSLTAAVMISPGPDYRIQVTDQQGAVVLEIDEVAGVEIDFSVDGIGLGFLSSTPGLPIGLANLATGEIRRYAAPELAATGEPVEIVDVRVE